MCGGHGRWGGVGTKSRKESMQNRKHGENESEDPSFRRSLLVSVNVAVRPVRRRGSNHEGAYGRMKQSLVALERERERERESARASTK
jgi:hypothetical protein